MRDMLWDIQLNWNFWFSLGVHLDHSGPYITLHFPLFLLTVGRAPITFGWSLRRGNLGNAHALIDAYDEDGTRYTAEVEVPAGGKASDIDPKMLTWRDEHGRVYQERDGEMWEITAARDYNA